jgi:hypothetical protein
MPTVVVVGPGWIRPSPAERPALRLITLSIGRRGGSYDFGLVLR